MAERVAARGHDVTVMCVKETGRRGIAEYDRDGIHYVEVPDLLPLKFRTGWDPWNAVHRWLYLRKNFDFDLVHAFETRPTTIHPLQWALRRRKIPLVIDWIDWWGRGGLITTNRPKWYQLLFGGLETFYEEHYRAMADASTVICTALGERAQGLGVRKDSIFRVIIGSDTEGIPFVKPATYRAEFGLNDSDPIALFSSLLGLMDVELAFDAAVKVKESYPQFKLVMTGNNADQLTRFAHSKGLGDSFVHLGMLPQDTFVRALTCADVFLLPFADKPYNRGRWPCKIGDYMAAGRPVVSNPVGEVQTLMQKHQVGVLTGFDPDSFAKGICEILSDPERAGQMQKTARRLAETELNWDKVIDELEAAYRYAVNASAHVREFPAENTQGSPVMQRAQ
jgi:glycosyltransferase involved in cell wall biosynthesis